jgi:hypothetical protein
MLRVGKERGIRGVVSVFVTIVYVLGVKPTTQYYAGSV